jgi:hypothetical protein
MSKADTIANLILEAASRDTTDAGTPDAIHHFRFDDGSILNIRQASLDAWGSLAEEPVDA